MECEDSLDTCARKKIARSRGRVNVERGERRARARSRAPPRRVAPGRVPTPPHGRGGWRRAACGEGGDRSGCRLCAHRRTHRRTGCRAFELRVEPVPTEADRVRRRRAAVPLDMTSNHYVARSTFVLSSSCRVVESAPGLKRRVQMHSRPLTH